MEEDKRQDFEINILAIQLEPNSKKVMIRAHATSNCEDSFGCAAVVSFFKKYPELLPIFKQSIDVVENHPHIAELLKEDKS
jgi:hypothetical protein